MVLSRWQRFGYAYVNFGQHVSVREYCRETGIHFGKLERADRFFNVEKLADQLMGTIQQVVPALPISLVATVMLESRQRGLGAFEVEARVNQLIEELERRGAHVYVSPRNRVESILSALNMLELRKLVRESGGIYKVVPEEIDVLTYYANAIAHWRQAADDSSETPEYSQVDQRE